jgi:hypothetical protein
MQDYERDKADKIAAEDRAYGREKGLIGMRSNDPEKSKREAWTNKILQTTEGTPEYSALEKEGRLRGYLKSSDSFAEQTDYTYDDMGNKVSEVKTKVPVGGSGQRDAELQDVTVNGKLIGHAATGEEAQAMVAQYRQSLVKTPDAAKPAPNPTARDIAVRNQFGQIDIAESKAKVVELYGDNPAIKSKLFAELDAMRR